MVTTAIDGTTEGHAGRKRQRANFQRALTMAHIVTAIAHVPFALALGGFAPPLVAMGGAGGLCVATAVRLQVMVHDARRPRWVTKLVDEPLLAHWCACVLATLLLPLTLLVGVLVGAVSRASVPYAIARAELFGYAFAALVAGFGLWVRRRFIRVVHVEVPIAGLAPELDGYRIAQVSDLHIGNHDPRERGLQWAERVNRLDADLVAVTGDLVTTGSHFYPDVADVIAAMRGKDGVFVSMGNHDQWDPDELQRLIEARGSRVLRNSWTLVRRGGAELVVAGIDDRISGKADLERTLAGRPERTPTLLLAHDPDFFPEASRRNVHLVLSGHTHGGQIAVPFIARRASLSRLARQTAAGLHVQNGSRLYVNAGLGTTGPPVRVGVAPEISVLVLRRT